MTDSRVLTSDAELFRDLLDGRLPTRANLTGLREGVHLVGIEAGWLRLPAGITIDDVSPQQVTVRLTRSGASPETARPPQK